MSAVTWEQVLERIAGLGPLQNVFLIGEDTDEFGTIAIWYPEIGVRGLLIERDDIARAVVTFLREYGVRRFKSWEQLREAEKREKWEGWDTCADYRRLQKAMEELAKRDTKQETSVGDLLPGDVPPETLADRGTSEKAPRRFAANSGSRRVANGEFRANAPLRAFYETSITLVVRFLVSILRMETRRKCWRG